MTGLMTKRWIVVGMVWCGIVYLSYANHQVIQHIKQQQYKIEQEKLDGRFINRHFDTVIKTMKQGTLLEQKVESVQLGVLAAEDLLISAAIDLDLMGPGVQRGQTPIYGNSVQLTASFYGSMDKALQWIDIFENEFPYISVTRIEMNEDPVQNTFRYQVVLVYRYSVAARGSAGPGNGAAWS